MTHCTFSELLQRHVVANVLETGGLQLFKRGRRHLLVERVDKVAHDGDEDPVAPVVVGGGDHVVVEHVRQGLGRHRLGKEGGAVGRKLALAAPEKRKEIFMFYTLLSACVCRCLH